MQFQKEKEKIIIIDFGSQLTKLIARRVRELGVYSEIIIPKKIIKIKKYQNIKGIILSGGPSTVTNKKFQTIPKEIFFKKIPVLGICYGLQLITKLFGGKIRQSKKRREFGRAFLIKRQSSLLTNNYLNSKKSVWMSHQDAVVNLPKNFKTIASTNDSKFTIIENPQKKIYGVQFHPEVTHTDNGKKIFKNFLFKICKMKKRWNVSSQQKRLINEIKETVKKDKVICALSGGVDSSVVALLVNKAIGKNLVCVMVDTGLMRKDEFKYTYKVFKNKYNLNIKLINASNLFFKKLKNISNPEKKRKIIGNLFIEVFEKFSKKKKKLKILLKVHFFQKLLKKKMRLEAKM